MPTPNFSGLGRLFNYNLLRQTVKQEGSMGGFVPAWNGTPGGQTEKAITAAAQNPGAPPATDIASLVFPQYDQETPWTGMAGTTGLGGALVQAGGSSGNVPLAAVGAGMIILGAAAKYFRDNPGVYYSKSPSAPTSTPAPTYIVSSTSSPSPNPAKPPEKEDAKTKAFNLFKWAKAHPFKAGLVLAGGPLGKIIYNANSPNRFYELTPQQWALSTVGNRFGENEVKVSDGTGSGVGIGKKGFSGFEILNPFDITPSIGIKTMLDSGTAADSTAVSEDKKPEPSQAFGTYGSGTGVRKAASTVTNTGEYQDLAIPYE